MEGTGGVKDCTRHFDTNSRTGNKKNTRITPENVFLQLVGRLVVQSVLLTFLIDQPLQHLLKISFTFGKSRGPVNHVLAGLELHIKPRDVCLRVFMSTPAAQSTGRGQ